MIEQIAMDLVTDEKDKTFSTQITHYEIVNYWKDKYITKDGDVVVKYDIDTISVVDDIGEPCCFACGYVPHGMIFANESKKIGQDLRLIWSQSKIKELEKAHVIPRALNGKAEPENMFLLCHKCHRLSPDTIYRKEFFRWVYAERTGERIFRIIENIKEECHKRGIPFIPNLLTANDIQKVINSHGGELSQATVPSALVGNAEENYESIVDYVKKTYGTLCGEVFDQEVREAIKERSERECLHIGKS